MTDLILEIGNQIGRLALFVIIFVYIANHLSEIQNNVLSGIFKGTLFGVLTAAVMIDPLVIAEGAVFDMRGGPAILSGILGGPIAALITAAIGGYVRYAIIGGPVALGGAVSFALYCAASIAIGYYLKKSKRRLSIVNLAIIGSLAFVSVIPSFFVSVDIPTGLAILKKAGFLLFIKNLASTIIIGIFFVQGTKILEYSKRMEADLKESARLARIAAETTNGVLITDENSQVEWVNRSFKRLSGRSPSESIKQHFGDLLFGPDSDKATLSQLSMALSEKKSFYGDILCYSKSGDKYWITLDMQPFFDVDGSLKFMSIQTDVTEKKLISDSLYAKQRQLEDVLNNMPGAILFTDPDRRIILRSNNLVKLYGVPEELLKPGALYDNFIRFIAKRGDYGEVDTEAVVRKRLASLQHPTDELYVDRPVTGSIYGIRRKQSPYGGTITIFNDITSQIQMNDDLTDAKSAAEAANQAKSQFLAAMSHEIRTPMTAILGFSDLLLTTEIDQNTRDKVKLIRESSEALMILINDILDLSKLESGKFELNENAYSPQEVITSIEKLFQGSNSALQTGQIELKTIIDAHFPEYTFGDGIRLRQILLNLVGNALKFTSSGAVSIKAKISSDNNIMRFEVTDTGEGIDPRFQEILFEDFTQGDSSVSRKYKGTGLGLAICKRLVDFMGGSIGVKSKLNSGSTFWFTLPYHECCQPKGNSPSQTPSVTSTKPMEMQPLLILVVDDSLTNRLLLNALLTNLGHQTVLVNDGLEAVEAVKQRDFDLVLMDIRMPVLSGIDATKQIRALPEPKRSVPIIAVTADLMNDNPSKYLDAGMNDCIEKPINRELLIKALETQMQK